MSAMFVGRVGGLAVALGIGAAALQAAAVAGADTTSPDQSPSSTSASAGRHATGGHAGTANGGRGSRPTGTPGARAVKSSEARTVANPAAVKVSAALAATATAAPAVSVASGAAADVAVPVAEDPAAALTPRGSVRAAASVTPPAASQVAAAAATYTQGNCTSASTGCTFVLSPSGVPIPSPTYIDTVMNYYVMPNTANNQTAQGVSTPEGAYPVTGIKSETIAISVPQGQTILENTINGFTPGPIPGSIPVTIFGYSQSAIISSLVQRKLPTPGYLPGLNRTTTSMVTVGQEMSPNGGWYARFPGLNLPSLGWTLYGSTPEKVVPTTNYTLEYDGFADYPRYPGNFLSDLNAALGILAVHINYSNPKYFAKTYGSVLGPDTYDFLMGTQGPGVACNAGSPSCTKLPSTAADQKYYFIQTPNLPLLGPVRAIPFIGNPLADLMQPFLKVIVDYGYADPAHGFENATQPMANVALPFGVFPHVKLTELVKKLAASIPQGFKDFTACLTDSACRKPPSGGSGPTINYKELFQNIPLRISAAVSAMTGPLLSAADFVNAALIGLPNYNISLMAEGLKQAASGQFLEGLTNFLFRPIAADIGMLTTFTMAQLTVSLLGVVGAITGCGPGAPTAGLCIVS